MKIEGAVFTTHDVQREIDAGYVSRREHPEDKNIVIYNYTNKATYDRHWNEVTLACRGLIVHEHTGEVLAKPFPKFFNYGENPDADEQIPEGEEPEVTEKHDGSLGIMYLLNGEVRWATRGSFTSDQAQIAQRIWDEKYKHLEDEWEFTHLSTNKTILVEIIDPKTRVVVDYKGASDLVIIGVIDKFTGRDHSHWDIKNIGRNLRMPFTKRKWITLDEAKSMQSEIDMNQEGWVLHWLSNGLRLKVKGDEYLAVHRMAYGLSTKKKAEYWRDGKVDELINEVPEEFREEIELIRDDLNGAYEFKKYDMFELFREIDTPSRKDFAKRVMKKVPQDYRNFMFKLHDMMYDIKENIYKNYRLYLD